MSKVKKTLTVGSKNYSYYSLKEAKNLGLTEIDKLPKSLKVLLENLLRHENGKDVTFEDAKAINEWTKTQKSDREIAYYPARVLMQDFTGVPAVVDLAAMREAMKKIGGDPKKINPLIPVDLVIDHSVAVDFFGQKDSFEKNVALEYERNRERYTFLKWGQKAFKNFRVVPPGTGICHQVNLEYLAQCVWTKTENGETTAYPDTCVGTDSHTTMINGLSVLGWGVGGIEAEAAMLGQSVTMTVPEVVGFKLTGKILDGITATDLVLTVTQMLRKHGVVEKFVEFYGPGIKELSLADRATIANMAPEYGATCGFFPVDEATIEYLTFTGRNPEQVALVEAYAKEQGLWFNVTDADPVFSSTLSLDLGTVVPCISGPKRPQDKIELQAASDAFGKELVSSFKVDPAAINHEFAVDGEEYKLKHGAVAIATITSCTNTSNPSVMIAAGLVAKKARALGLKTSPWVKTALSPGSKVVTDYLIESGLQQSLDELGFTLAGYGCMSCIGNSGPLPEHISKAVNQHNLVVTSVLSGNRNFEGRINPDVKANYLASPPLVIAYAIAGNINVNLSVDSLGKDKSGKDVFLKDIWPSNTEVSDTLNKHLSKEMFKARYANVFDGDKYWQAIKITEGEFFDWEPNSTYIRNPTFFENILDATSAQLGVTLKDARILGLFGDSITTDHISPAGSIKKSSPAGTYLLEKGVAVEDFNSYGSRRGNHEVMMRGTFANIRIKNEMAPGTEGGVTKYIPTGEVMSIYDAAMKYVADKTPLVVIAGKEYGTGSSRDWAAKGPFLQGVKAVITESFERIHRSNLIGMGVLPLVFEKGMDRKVLGLDGTETISLIPQGDFRPGMKYDLIINYPSGKVAKIEVTSRVDTLDELHYMKNGGILQYVLRNLK
ncbi:MAG: aconitate hydratase AcnA [Bacteriovorax sp.]|nr:aconitate hydratase AcnA [Bacteriovorax sp.]